MHAGKVVVDLSGLLALGERVEREVNAELLRVGMDFLGACIAGATPAPVDEGTLRGSHSLHLGGVRVATGVDVGAQVEPGAEPTPLEGGAGTDHLHARVVANSVYAAYQHETIELNHPKGGVAKWMERTLAARQAMYRRRLAAAAKRGATGEGSA